MLGSSFVMALMSSSKPNESSRSASYFKRSRIMVEDLEVPGLKFQDSGCLISGEELEVEVKDSGHRDYVQDEHLNALP